MFFAVGDDADVDVVSTRPHQDHRGDVLAAMDLCPVLLSTVLHSWLGVAPGCCQFSRGSGHW